MTPDTSPRMSGIAALLLLVAVLAVSLGLIALLWAVAGSVVALEALR